MGGEISKVSDIFMEEQEWVPGYEAPFALWLTMAGAAAFLIMGTVWIIKHNHESN